MKNNYTGSTKPKFSAFTLIELLVVIAIIAILAAILFPVFARARENARRSSCQSNLKQISLGVFQYTQDYDESYPILFAPAGNWTGVLKPYLKSDQIFVCPSDTVPVKPVTGTPAKYTSYSINLDLAYDATNNVPRGINQATLTQTVLTVLMADSLGNGAGDTYAYDTGCAGATTCSNPGLATFIAEGSNGPAQRHLEGQNFAFCDGHVKWFKGQNATTSAKVYNKATTLANTPASANSPTYNLTP